MRVDQSQSPPAAPTTEALEVMLPLRMIRRHLKIDDYSGVADDTLALLRAAAVEAFEAYTGRVTGPRRALRQPIILPQWTSVPQAARARMMCSLKHPAVDGIVTLEFAGKTKLLRLPARARQFEWPLSFPRPWAFNAYPLAEIGLVNESASGPSMEPEPPYATYVTGGDALEAMAAVGCLKHIAWNFENPGDSFVTLADGHARSGMNGLAGTNNTTMASGAYEAWRKYRRVAR